MQLQGVIFDLDGTLVDSRLDFAAMRREMDLPPGEPILEALDALPSGADKEKRLAILREHELRGARQATLMPGAESLLAELTRRELRQGILTRNSRESTGLVLKRLGLSFSDVMTREDVLPKPDPSGLLHICRTWNIAAANVLFMGDYLFDIQCGREAEMPTLLFAPGELPEYAPLANYAVRSFSEATELIVELHDGSLNR
jgi:HAD superfamily hydrolase (TIGR01549 family)